MKNITTSVVQEDNGTDAAQKEEKDAFYEIRDMNVSGILASDEPRNRNDSELATPEGSHMLGYKEIMALWSLNSRVDGFKDILSDWVVAVDRELEEPTGIYEYNKGAEVVRQLWPCDYNRVPKECKSWQVPNDSDIAAAKRQFKEDSKTNPDLELVWVHSEGGDVIVRYHPCYGLLVIEAAGENVRIRAKAL